jgi:nucleotide-binding universal stress UspA family protein
MGFGFAPVRTEHDLEARRALEHTIQRVLGPTPSIDITSKVVHGHPATVLIEESRSADLLVLGDRGYEGFAGLLLGHVGEHCARHAHCSVVIVRGHER